MKLTKIMTTLMTVLFLAVVPAMTLAEDNYGSAGVTEGQTYTLQEMLTYAIQDEYAAQAEYQAIIAAYGETNAFSNILKAEATHIALLETLFNTYGIAIPQNTAQVTLPASLDEAYVTGVAAENANIAMYANFLSQTDLPDDVRISFTALQNASQSHLSAFTQNAENTGLGLQNGAGNQYGQNDDSDTQTQGMGNNRRSDTMMNGQGKNQRYNDNSNQNGCDCDECINDGNGNGNGNATCDGDCDLTQQNQQRRNGNSTTSAN